MNTHTIPKKQPIDFSHYTTDQKATHKERSIFKEMKDGFTPDEIIDQHQIAMGIKEPPKTPTEKFRHKTRVFNLANKEHANTYERLLNEPEFRIWQTNENWSPLGEFMIAVHYSEIIKETKENKDEQSSSDKTTPIT